MSSDLGVVIGWAQVSMALLAHRAPFSQPSNAPSFKRTRHKLHNNQPYPSDQHFHRTLPFSITTFLENKPIFPPTTGPPLDLRHDPHLPHPHPHPPPYPSRLFTLPSDDNYSSSFIYSHVIYNLPHGSTKAQTHPVKIKIRQTPPTTKEKINHTHKEPSPPDRPSVQP